MTLLYSPKAQIPITVGPDCSNHGPGLAGYWAIKYLSMAEGLVPGQTWMKGHRLHCSECRSRTNTDLLLTESCVELVQAEVAVVVVVVVPQQVLHGALQQTVLHVLLHGDLTHTCTNVCVGKFGKFHHKEHRPNKRPRACCRRYMLLTPGRSVTSCPGARQVGVR